MTGTHDIAIRGDAAALARELTDAVGDASPWLGSIPFERTALRPRPGGWSPREIIGHLIDSAFNNHGRFVRAALADSMVFATYDQDAWVAVQRYQEDDDWQLMLARWAFLNHQLAWTIGHIPEERLVLPRGEHNLDRIAWKPVPTDEPVTLAWFIRDYIGHLRHHLTQIAALEQVNEREMRGSRCRMGPRPGA